jgi:hypothetical protein
MTKPPTYKISTLRDIFELPTIEAMERCLKELSEMMVSSRAYSEMIRVTADHLAAKEGKTLPPGPVFEWPEVCDWTDGGCVINSEIKFVNHDGSDFTVMKYTKAAHD